MNCSSSMIAGILVLFVFHQSTASQTFIKGMVNGVWTKNNSPYVLIGDVTIDTLLTIEAGVRVLSKGRYKIYSQSGRIRALGTASDSIYFSTFDNTTVQWLGIQLRSSGLWQSKIMSLFEYCRIEKAYIGLTAGSTQADNPHDTVRYCTFENNYYGLGGHIDFGSRPIIYDCIFKNNTYGYWAQWIVPSITNCQFIDNKIGLYFYTATGIISNCTIMNCDSIGIWVENSSYQYIGTAPDLCNRFINNKMNLQYMDGNTPSALFNATYNYWGTTQLSEIKRKIKGNFNVLPFVDSNCVVVQTGVREFVHPSILSMSVFPNPTENASRQQPVVQYTLATPSFVRIEVRDVLGIVRNLLEREDEQVGEQRAFLSNLQSGIYFVRISTKDDTFVRTLIVR